MTGLQTLYERREERCLNFSLKCIKHPQNSRFFPINSNIQNNIDIRDRENFHVNFARTEDYKKSTIPHCQRLLNSYFKEKELPKNIKSKFMKPI